MKQITIRKIPAEVERKAKAEAKKKGLSLNKAFLSLLERASGVSSTGRGKKTRYHDLDHLSGKWTAAEADAFRRNLESQRRIDEDLWKAPES